MPNREGSKNACTLYKKNVRRLLVHHPKFVWRIFGTSSKNTETDPVEVLNFRLFIFRCERRATQFSAQKAKGDKVSFSCCLVNFLRSLCRSWVLTKTRNRKNKQTKNAPLLSEFYNQFELQLLRGEALEPPNKRQMMSPYFLSELSHLIGYCEDNIPFVHLAHCVSINARLF